MSWVLLVDFDGTITPVDVGPLILSRFTGDRWVPLNEAWDRGEVTTAERAEGQWAMVEADEAAAQALLDQAQLDRHCIMEHETAVQPRPRPRKASGRGVSAR
jgi:2-hydroxy-3-keto-5-methylthiopentenyl-1-phosphate phosphatase